MQLYDTVQRKVVPLQLREPGKVSIYVCGPTVYGPPHIGHGRMVLVYDMLRRYLAWTGLEVTFVSNITDIDDAIIDRALREDRDPAEIAVKCEAVWWSAMDTINVQRPDLIPHATEYVDASALEVGAAVTVDASTITGITTSDDDVTLCATALTLATSIAIGTGTLRLSATTSSISQTGGTITAQELGARAADSVNLAQSNDVDEFAAEAGTGSVTFIDADGYTVGEVTVDGCFNMTVTGITTNTDFETKVGSGDIALTSALNINGTARLEATTGNITQDVNGKISADNLLVRAVGNIDLNAATGGNEVDNVVAFESTSSGNVEFEDADGFIVGTIADGICVNGFSGITTASGHIDLDSDADDIQIQNNILAGDSGDVDINTTTAGDVILTGTITAADNTVTINSVGNINGGGLVTANRVDLDAGTGIGDSTEVNLAATNIAADNTSGNVNMNNALGTAVAVSSLSTDSGNITFDQTSGGDVTFTSAATTTSGNIELNNATGSMTATAVSTETGNIGINATDGNVDAVSVATTTSGNIDITADSGNITATSVSAGTATSGDGNITLTTTTQSHGTGYAKNGVEGFQAPA